MTVFAIAFIISSFLTGKYILKYLDRLLGCYIGAVFVIIYLFGLGLLEYTNVTKTLLIESYIFQVIGGFGKGLNSSSSIAILSSYKEREKYIGYMEVAGSLGRLFGPIIGVLFYNIAGFVGPFIILGAIFLVSLFCLAFCSCCQDKPNNE